MSNKDNGGPAFPGGKGAGDVWVSEGGMTLRDYFAAKASEVDIQEIIEMNTYIVNGNPVTGVSRQQARYIHADPMLKERSK